MRTRIYPVLRLIPLALALCLVLSACGGGENAPIKKGETYRDFTATLADGGSFTLSEEEGKVILLNFWATWCGPCVMEMPAFPRLIEKYGDRLCLVAANCAEDEQTVKKFLSDNGYTFPVVLDPEGTVAALYPTDSIPYTLIIAPNGKVVHIATGAGDADSMFEYYSNEIDRALE